MSIDIDKIAAFANTVWDKREALNSRYEEIARYFFPERGGFINSVEDREAIWDATPEDVNSSLAASLHSLLTNPASAWFNLDIIDSELADKELTEWLAHVQRMMLEVFNAPETAFQNEVNTFYLDLAPLGWSIFYTADEPGEPILFKAITPAECAIAEDKNGRVDTLVRRYKMPVSLVHESFGTLSDKNSELLAKSPLAEVSLVHLVIPYKRLCAMLDDCGDLALIKVKKQKYVSIYYEQDSKFILRLGGFFEFPFQIPRWSKASCEVYGRGPGWTALADVRVLNKVCEAQLIAAEKQSDPPLLVPNDAVLGKIRTFAGGVTYYDPIRGGGNITSLPVAVDLATMQDIISAKQEAIRKTFLHDRINIFDNPNMTATEVLARENKQMLILGPVLGRLQTEFLGPLVERVFAILSRRGVLPLMPKSLRCHKLRVKYISPIAKAQRQLEASSFAQATAFLAPVINASVECLDNFDSDAIARDSQELFGYPAKYLRSPEETMKIRQLRLAAQTEGLAGGLGLEQMANLVE